MNRKMWHALKCKCKVQKKFVSSLQWNLVPILHPWRYSSIERGWCFSSWFRLQFKAPVWPYNEFSLFVCLAFVCCCCWRRPSMTETWWILSIPFPINLHPHAETIKAANNFKKYCYDLVLLYGYLQMSAKK